MLALHVKAVFVRGAHVFLLLASASQLAVGKR
jgi:hypothetical protein